MQTIQIRTIRVGSISNIGSLNIGKVILARNQVTTIESGGEADDGGAAAPVPPVSHPETETDAAPGPFVPPPIMPADGWNFRDFPPRGRR